MTVRVLVVDDSAFMRVFLGKFIEENPKLELAGTARNGQDAIEKTKALRPDVITMDVEMPKMNGIEAVRTIMREVPTPVIMLSSLTKDGADATVQALQFGAFDFLAKPEDHSPMGLSELAEQLDAKIMAAAKIPVQRFVVSDKPKVVLPEQMAHMTPPPKEKVKQVVAIGTSTGGPRALNYILPKIPADFPCPIVIVQHMPAKFTKSLAERLNSQSQIEIVEAENHQVLENGKVYIAPGGLHMRVISRFGQFLISLEETEKRNEHRPSVDVLFESIAVLPNILKHYILLTGMGSDGARGMLKGKASGAASTIAESSNTCVVFGMPKSAIELDCVDYVVDLHEIPKKMKECVFG